jgi:hypothetical protein
MTPAEHVTRPSVLRADDLVYLRMSRENYLGTLDDLGSGVFIVDARFRLGSAIGGPAVLPLPRYRKRTRDGGHAP